MTTIQDIPLTTITGAPTTLAEYSGKVLLIVNVASKCGLTPQYEGLEKLYEQYRERGLVVLGFPANNFLGQEPGSDDEIAEFCRATYSIGFQVTSSAVRVVVDIEETDPGIWRWKCGSVRPAEVGWTSGWRATPHPTAASAPASTWTRPRSV